MQGRPNEVPRDSGTIGPNQNNRLTDPEFIAALRQGQDAAYELLVRQYGGRVYHTALGFLQNEQEAEDLAQEVFVRVFERIGSFRGDADLGTWIYRIAVTASLDALRRRKRKKRGAGLLGFFNREEDPGSQADFHHPGIVAEKKEDAALLFKAIRQLPEAQQTAFLLLKLEGLSQAEAAAIMNIREGALESLLQRAKANLRKSLHQLIRP